MKKFTAVLTVLLFTSSLYAQTTSPDWANKQGAIGIGLSTTLGSTSYTNSEAEHLDQNRNSTTAFGLHFCYNPLSFLNAQLIIGQSNSKYINVDEDPMYAYESSGEFKGFVGSLRLIFPLFGINGSLTPNCTGGLSFAPNIGLTRMSGTDTWRYIDKGPFPREDETVADYSKFQVDIGGRLEYFLPPFMNLNASAHLNLNLLSYNQSNYEEQYKGQNETGVYLFNTNNTFGVFGFTVWFK